MAICCRLGRVGVSELFDSGIQVCQILCSYPTRLLRPSGRMGQSELGIYRRGAKPSRLLSKKGAADRGKFRLSPDGSLAVRITPEGIAVWDTATGRELLSTNCKVPLSDLLAICPKGKHLVFKEQSGQIFLSEWRTGNERDITLKDKHGKTTPGPHICTFSSDASHLVLADVWSGDLCVYSIADKVERYRLSEATGVTISPDGKELAICNRAKGSAGVLRFLDFGTGKEQRRFDIEYCSTLIYSPDKRGPRLWGRF